MKTPHAFPMAHQISTCFDLSSTPLVPTGCARLSNYIKNRNLTFFFYRGLCLRWCSRGTIFFLKQRTEDGQIQQTVPSAHDRIRSRSPKRSDFLMSLGQHCQRLFSLKRSPLHIRDRAVKMGRRSRSCSSNSSGSTSSPWASITVHHTQRGC